jgi:hypothetical protein
MKAIAVILLLLLALGCALAGNSQVITNAEYFINTDPGVGNGIALNISSNASINTNFSISTNNLSNGFNQLFIRFKDQNNNWGIAEQRSFFIDHTLNTSIPNLIAAEYFIDTDPALAMEQL